MFANIINNKFQRLPPPALIICFIATTFSASVTGSCLGCLELDELTFEKIIPKFEYSLVKFDIAFPYGEKHEAYGEFAKTFGINLENLLVALVGIKDYGEKENSMLARRFGVDDKSFPQILLFSNSSAASAAKAAIGASFPQPKATWPPHLDINLNNIKKFLVENSQIYIGLDGCVQQFDTLAVEFVGGRGQPEILEKSKKLLTENSTNEMFTTNGKLYIAVMEKLLQNSNFIQEENQRLINLLKGKLSENKKKEFQKRLNVLNSFKLRTGKKDEL